MTKLKELIHEVHRRSLWQVLGIYVAASWIALQVVETLSETVGVPEWFGPVAFGILIIGLPIVLATAFVQEGVGGEGAVARRPAGDASPETTDGASAIPSPTPGAGEAEEAAVAVDRAAAGGRAAVTPTGRHRLFTWRNAILAGVGAFALLGLATGGYLTMRTLGIGPAGTLQAKGILEERTPILLAEFASESGDEELARAATELFRVDLTQSEVVRLAEPAFVTQALGRMERDPATPLDLELARELAVREGIPAVVGGDVLSAGGSFVVSARLVRPETGEELAAYRETAEDSSAIVPSIDRLSGKLREKIGESLRSVSREEPLEQVTTGDLEALRKYSDALRAQEIEGDDDRAIALLEEAVGLDSTFAMAWRKLGVIHFNRGAREEYEEALTRAYALRDRLTEKERYVTEASYHQAVTEDRQAAITAYENLLQRDPESTIALNNLGVLYSREGEDEAAADRYARALAVDTTVALYHNNLVQARVSLGRHVEAEEVLEAAARRFPTNPGVAFTSARAAAARMAWDTARTRYETIPEVRPGDPGLRAGSEAGLEALARIQGKLEEARRHEEAAQAARVQDGRDPPTIPGLGLAWEDIMVRRDPDRAAARADSILDAHPLEEIPEEDRPYGFLANIYGLAGRADRARAYAASVRARAEEAAEEEGEALEEQQLAGLRLVVALAEGRHEDAVEAAETLRAAAEGDCAVCDLPPIAETYDRAGRADSARALWERYATTPEYGRFWQDQWNLAHAYERLGQLYEEAGDLEKAALYYGKFTELWADADPDLQPRVEAARERLEAILAERG